MHYQMQRRAHTKLGQAFATAICGNDILSSCLYVSGIAVLFAGIYAPLVLLAIGGVLYLYKLAYTEVVEALPVNGGAYNCLLNSTSKNIAATAGVMTFLSYIATAVISAKVGVEYLASGVSQWATTFYQAEIALPTVPLTIGVLFVFALLVISGVKDSARVAFAIFVTHIVTLIGFLVMGVISIAHDPMGEFLSAAHTTGTLIAQHGGFATMMYLGFSACLLGVSGFESSANFVEEQEKGVFRLTLRNMLLGVVIFNPLIALIVLHALPYETIVASKDFVLADAADALGGLALRTIVSIDAFLVLCGAVLTAYVGVSGLLFRMSADACIPRFFAKENSRGSFPRIILGFFLLCSSILVLTGGDLLSLAGVYTIAFLCVMSMFALGNLILKESRSELKRTYRAPVFAVLLAFFATIFGVMGNIRIDPNNLQFFELYFFPCMIVVAFVIYQDYFFKFLLRVTKDRLPRLHSYINHHFSDLTHGKFAAFIHRTSKLHNLLRYIDRNETGWDITLVTCDKDGERTHEELKEMIPVLQKAGLYPYFKISLLHKDEPFGPDIIHRVAEELDIRTNRVLIGTIHHTHKFEYGSLGGVRIIAE